MLNDIKVYNFFHKDKIFKICNDVADKKIDQAVLFIIMLRLKFLNFA